MWEEIRSVWYGLKELLEIPRPEEQSWGDWFVSQVIIVFLMIVIIAFNFREFFRGWKSEKKSMFRECTVCKDGYDVTHLDYPLVDSFCPQCVKDISEQGLALIVKFREWGYKQVDVHGSSISGADIKGIVLSVFYAIKNKAPREPLFDALLKYTKDNVGDTVTLSELLEELSVLQEIKKGTTNVREQDQKN